MLPVVEKQQVKELFSNQLIPSKQNIFRVILWDDSEYVLLGSKKKNNNTISIKFIINNKNKQDAEETISTARALFRSRRCSCHEDQSSQMSLLPGNNIKHDEQHADAHEKL